MKKKEKIDGELKPFHFKMPRETWVHLKNSAVANDCSMSDFVVSCLEANRRKVAKKLKDLDADL